MDYDREYSNCIRCGILLTREQEAFCSKGCQIIWLESMGSTSIHKIDNSEAKVFDPEDDNFQDDERRFGYHIETLKSSDDE